MLFITGRYTWLIIKSVKLLLSIINSFHLSFPLTLPPSLLPSLLSSSPLLHPTPSSNSFLPPPSSPPLQCTFLHLQVEQMKHKDCRNKLMNEVLSAIRLLKFYAWEPCFEERVQTVREKELSVLAKFTYLNAVGSFTFSCTPFFVS